MNQGIKIIFIYSTFLNQTLNYPLCSIKQLLYSVQLPWQEYPIYFIFFHFKLNGMFFSPIQTSSLLISFTTLQLSVLQISASDSF